MLASFRSEARGIKFYVLTSEVCVGQSLHFQLEPLNPYDSDCVAIYLGGCSDSESMLGHLAREAASYLAPLLREGFQGLG